MTSKRRIAVIGGGPAGMMAAIRAADFCDDVTLFEHNKILGRKLLLTGKGRCNLTNNCSLDEFLERFSGRKEFLRDAFKVFFTQELCEFFEARNVPLKCERQNRVFPKSDRSSDIVAALGAELARKKVRIEFNTRITGIQVRDQQVCGIMIEDETLFECQNVILATGGLSYSGTGASPIGFHIAKKIGHRIIDLRPGLIGLSCTQDWPPSLEGLVLKNIELKFCSQKKEFQTPVGELLFTDKGISGPLVISASGMIIDWLNTEKSPVHVFVDCKPGLTSQQLDQRILREIAQTPKKNMLSIVKLLLPMRMSTIFLKICGVDPLCQGGQLSLEKRRKIVENLKKLPLTISAPESIDKAMVTRGGVDLKEINPRTMQSRLIHGLYFAGEMIDIDADTGGFNLQAAFSTGYLAGQSAGSIKP